MTANKKNVITQLTPEQFAAQKASAAKENFVLRDAVEADIAANVLTGGLPDQTISSRLANAAVQGKWWGRLGVKVLDVFQKNHGAKAQAGDTERAEALIADEEKFDGNQK